MDGSAAGHADGLHVPERTTARALRRASGPAVVVALLLVTLALLVPRIADHGSEMDEGAVLAYSALVLDGAVPHRDFLTFYGPGNLWLVAGSFAVFGTSITTERAVGVLYRLLIVLALAVLAWRLAGLVGASLAGIIALAILARDIVWASPVHGSIGFGLLGLALATWALSRGPGRARRLTLLGAGACGGAAVLERFDIAPAIVLSAIPLVLLLDSRERWWYVGGFAVLAGLYLPHLLIVGPEKVERLVSDLRATGDGRSLPIPGPSMVGGDLLFAAAAVTAALIAVGALLRLRNRRQLEPQLLLSLGLFNACLFPYALFRADIAHIRPVAIVPLSILPAFVLLCTRVLVRNANARAAVTVGVALVTAAMLATRGELEVRGLRDLPQVENAGRTFYLDASRARAIDSVVEEADRLSKAGERLYVGPADLRRMNYGPTYIYFLLPKLEPASYYMEMNPLTANREGSGLADELRRADWLILTSQWDGWAEPNASSELGPAEPNEVVRDSFCQRFAAWDYRLYERCDRRGSA